MKTTKTTENIKVSTAYSTFSVLFYINRQKVKKSGLCPLMGRISINAEIFQFSAKMDVDPDLWDAHTCREKGKSRHALEVNRHIERLTNDISRYHADIVEEQGYVTAELVKNALNGIGRKKDNLLELFAEHNEEYTKRIGVNRVKRSIVAYKAVYKQLQNFLAIHYEAQDISLGQLTLSFIQNFDSYLRQEKGFTPYTVSSYTILLRKIIRRAISQGTLRINPFADYIPEQPPRKRRHMTQEELDKFMQVEIASQRVCHTRDMFVFATFTGLSYVDMCNLSEEHIRREKNGRLWIRIRRQKTGSECEILLLDIPLRIMEKYKSERKTEKIFNMVAISCVSVNLEKVARLCGIERRITYHMARHNFGTLVTLSQGVPLETVSRMMGHKCFRTTQIYARMTNRKVNEDMKRLATRIGNKYKAPEDTRTVSSRKKK